MFWDRLGRIASQRANANSSNDITFAFELLAALKAWEIGLTTDVSAKTSLPGGDLSGTLSLLPPALAAGKAAPAGAPATTQSLATLAPPGDPLFAQQWHLTNPVGGINVLPVWDRGYTGAGIAIANFDQGVDRFHVDLDKPFSVALSMNAHTAAVGSGHGVPLLAGDNHGTATAGIMVAERNGIGVVGIAYGATLISEYSDLAFANIGGDAYNAFTWSRMHADVMNNSWGFGNLFFSSPNSAFVGNFKTTYATAGAAVADAGQNGRGGLGTVLVQSAGNTNGYGDDTNLSNFSNNRFTITVAAGLQDGTIAPYSTHGASILVTAPGSPLAGTIVTTDRSGTAGYNTGAGYLGDYTTSFNGTSAAAPMVSGIAALMLEANPNLTNRDVQEILAYSAKLTGSSGDYVFNGARDWNGGGLHTSNIYGFGLVDAAAAVRLAETWAPRSNWSSGFSGTVTPALAIPDFNATGVSSNFSISGGANFRLLRIEIDLNITHTWIGDLIVKLTSPSGTVSTLVNRPGSGALGSAGSNQANISFVVSSVQFWGEADAVGTWTLTVSDVNSADTGTLNSYTWRAYDEFVTDNTYVYTNEYATYAGILGHSQTLTDTNDGIDTINAAAVTTGSLINLNQGAVSTIAGKSLTIDIGTQIENAIGGDGSDTLIGNALANLLRGGRGSDLIVGGAGIDTAVYTGDFSNYYISRLTDGGLRVIDTRTGNPDGVDSVYGVELFNFRTETVKLSQMSDITDFNVFLYDTATNNHREWTMSGGAIGGNINLGTLPSAWKVVATGDFNGDGFGDPIWMNRDTGDIRAWLMGSSGTISTVTLGVVPAGWRILGTGDFNGDGTSDLLWQNTVNGSLRGWLMRDGALDTNVVLGSLPSQWRVVATGDFNADGNYDIFWRNISTGELREWMMNDGNVAAVIPMGATTSSWGIAATGDFNHDHTSDLIWRNVATGETRVWLMSESGIASNTVIGTLPSTWKVIGSGDYNQDGHDDLLWRNNSTGEFREWLMVNGTLSSNVALPNLPSNWQPSVNPATHSDYLAVI